MDWSPVMTEQCPQKAYTVFHNQLTKLFEAKFPIKTSKIGYLNRHPWITFGLKTCIKKKHKLYIKSLRYTESQEAHI